MSLTPKNWKSFQHYTDRSPSWIKLHRALLNDIDFHRLPLASRALAPMLWLLASEYDAGQITASLEDIAWRFRMSLTDLTEAMQPLLDKGFFALDQDASVSLAACKQDAMPRREEKRERREETDSRSQTRPARPPSRFDEFWKLYPRRDGPNPRKPAEQRFESLVKTGLDPQMLIDEVRKFAGLEDTRKNLGSRFIPHAVTWLNQQRWSDHAAVAFLADEPLSSDDTLDACVATFARLRIWSKHAPCNAPGSPGCTVTPEMFAKHGLNPDGSKLQPPEAA